MRKINTQTIRARDVEKEWLDDLRWQLTKQEDGKKGYVISDVLKLVHNYVPDITYQDLLDAKPKTKYELTAPIVDAIKQITFMAHTNETKVINFLLDFALTSKDDYEEIAKEINNVAQE